MKKLLAILLCLVMVLSLVACGGSDDADKPDETKANEETKATEEATKPDAEPTGDEELSIALILPGVITDESWNYTAYQGLEQLKAEGYKTQYVENTDTSNCEAVAMNFVDEGYSLVIAHGSQFGDAMWLRTTPTTTSLSTARLLWTTIPTTSALLTPLFITQPTSAAIWLPRCPRPAWLATSAAPSPQASSP